MHRLKINKGKLMASSHQYIGDVKKIALMTKRSRGRRRVWQTVNLKERIFVLTNKYLLYFTGSLANWKEKGVEKARIPLKNITIIEAVDDEAFMPSRPNSFQVGHMDGNTELVLYITAKDEGERNDWVTTIQEVCRNNEELHVRYHCGALVDGEWTCCKQIETLAEGCKQNFKYKLKPQKLLPDLPPPSSTLDISVPPIPPVASLKIVVALYDYKPVESSDLPLKRGQSYNILDDKRQHWWKARDNMGNEGFIPSNYVQEESDYTAGLEKYDWYSSTVDRIQAENDLKAQCREGCFIVRKSSQAGKYTLSLFTAQDSTGKVHHYKISVNDESTQFWISQRHSCSTIPELIEYHKHNPGGLPTRLRFPPDYYNSVPSTAGLGHDLFQLDHTKLSLVKQLGAGQFGEVFLGNYKDKQVAVKKMREGSMTEDDFIDEALVMKDLKHDNLVQLLGICRTEVIYIITEYVRKGNLQHYMRRHPELLKDDQTLLFMCKQVASGMEYLETNRFIHRDLAARNCLVGDNYHVKVGDFGLTRFVVDDEYISSTGSKFPIKWAPPEVLLFTRFSSKSDVWSFGILLWEVFSGGKTPYPTMSNAEVAIQISDHNYRMKCPPDCPQTIYRKIMLECWNGEPEQRPSFRELFAKIVEILDRED